MIKFGTGGWRAIIADEFTRDNIRLLSAGLCRLMKDQGFITAPVCIGYDRRFLSKESAHWAAEVFALEGHSVFMVNRSSPTPLIMYTIKEKGYPYGLAITASHNPAIYNGIKVFTAGGRDADKSVTNEIEKRISCIDPEQIPAGDYDELKMAGLICEGTLSNEYIDSVLSSVDTQAIKNSGLKIALDPMYGVSRTILQTILITCRCDVEVIHDRHDTLFGGKLPAPNEDTLIPLSHFVKDQHADIGIATDGDADRLGVIDEKGAFVHPNTLLLLLYYYLLKYKGMRGACVRNNSTTHLLDRVADAFGETCYEVPVGFKYVSAKMQEADAIIGGESSGGLAVKGHIFGKDGIYAAALLTEMLAKTGRSLSELYKEITDQFGELFYADADFKTTPMHKETLKQQLLIEKQLPDFNKSIDHISYEDGCKVYFSDGSWIICRFSGTEPLLRMASEAVSAEEARYLIQKWKAALDL